jgi:hypothetical protein
VPPPLVYDPAPLVSAEELTDFLGRPLDTEDDAYRLHEVARLVSDLIRGHVRQTVTAATSTAYLAGTLGRRLTLPEAPVVAVSAVAVDGAPLTPADYSWRRSGALWRPGGWGSPESEVVVTYSHGYAAVPGDLRAVAMAAAARLLPNLAQVEYESTDGYAVRGGFAGWTLAERLVLDRYRRKATAL